MRTITQTLISTVDRNDTDISYCSTLYGARQKHEKAILEVKNFFF